MILLKYLQRSTTNRVSAQQDIREASGINAGGADSGADQQRNDICAQRSARPAGGGGAEETGWGTA